MIRLISLGLACAGAAWQAQAGPVTVQASGGPHDAYFAIDFHGRDGLVAGLYGETLQTSDGGLTWSPGERIGDGSAILGVALAKDRALAVGQSGMAWQRSGGSWQPVDTGQSERWMNVDLSEDGLAVAVGGFGALAVSQDGGTSWTLPELDWETLIDDWVEPHLFDVTVLDGKITVVGEFGLVLQSIDRGRSWAVRSKREESLFALDIQSDGTGYAAGQSGLVLRTADGGTSWTECGSPGEGNYYGAAARGQSVAVVGMRTAAISEDGCASFRPVQDTETASGWLEDVVPAQGKPGFYAIGDRGRVLRLSATP